MAAGRPQEVMARWLNISQTQLSRIERGRPVADLGRLIQWAQVLAIPPALLWFDMPSGPSSRAGGQAAADASVAATGEGIPPVCTDEVSKTQRRDFLRLGGSLMAGPVIAGTLDGELDRMHIVLDRGTASEERVTYLENVADDLGIQAGRAADCPESR